MKTRFAFFIALITAVTLSLPLTHSAHAETAGDDAYTQIKALTEKIAELQKQLAELTQEVRTVLKEGLSEGMTDADIQKIQELLATDKTIYPEGKVTGFFGPLTKQALKRFQKLHGVTDDGTINKETRALLEKYLKENKGLSRAFVKTGDMYVKDTNGNTLTCTKDAESGKFTCTNKKKEDTIADKKERATEAIEAAEEAIDEAEDAIEESEADTLDDATSYLEKAKDKLEVAQEAFDEEDYEQARSMADGAREYAKKALLKLE